MKFVSLVGVLILAFALSASIFAQDDTPPGEIGAIEGSTRDASGTPLGNVQVLLDGAAQIGVASDSNGHFEFPELPVGSYDVTFSIDGFKSLQKHDVKVTSGRVTELDVKLVREAGSDSRQAASHSGF